MWFAPKASPNKLATWCLNCTGGTATPKGKAIPQQKITLALNTDVTSPRLLKGSDLSAALLIIDEAFPANPVPSGTTHSPDAPPQILCTPLGSRSRPRKALVPARALTGRNRTSSLERKIRPTPFQWTIPLDAPGTSGTRTLRLTNLRADPFPFGVSSTLTPTQILAFVETQGSQPVILENPEVVLTTILPGILTSVVPSKPIKQCDPHNAVLLGGSGKAAFDFSVQVEENFSSAFQIRNYGTVLGPTSPLVEQKCPLCVLHRDGLFLSQLIHVHSARLGWQILGLAFTSRWVRSALVRIYSFQPISRCLTHSAIQPEAR